MPDFFDDVDQLDEKDRLSGDQKIPFREFFRRVFVYLKPEWPRFTCAALLLMDVLAAQLKDVIDREVPPEEPLYLIGFSMGGLVSRYYFTDA